MVWAETVAPKTLSYEHASPLDLSPEAAALGLLGAAAFSQTFSTLSWSDEKVAAKLLHAPLRRVPNTPEALNTWLGGDGRQIRDTARETLTHDGATYEITYPMDGFDGSRLWIEERAERMSGDGKRPGLILGLLRDVTEKRQADMDTARRAFHDPLTNLWNRARFTESLNYELSASELRTEPGFVAAVRLTGLENINNMIGYEAGDFLLRHVAQKIQEDFPLPRSAARISGTGFGLLLPGTSREQAEALVKDLGVWISEGPHASPFGDLYSECEISGLALSAGPDASNQLALLETQLRPRSSGIDFSATKLSAAPKLERGIEARDILAALSEGRLALAYQPIIDAKTRELNHFECLLRVQDKDGELRSAADMIIAAEGLGYVNLLDRRALEIGSKTLKQYPDIHLAFNVSAGTLKSELAVESYLAALRALGPDTARVTLELTETLALDDPLDATRFAAAARSLGCKFAIDDFGSGHTTFQNLMSIEADIIKIDGSMVKDLSGAPHKQTFVRMMVDLARTFGVETVAEMVNSEADAALMTRMGVTYFQGYMFGMPGSLPEFSRLKRA